ncbi:MAG: hypothetical protein U0790_17155 [Isosphaeraceae bacterium]
MKLRPQHLLWIVLGVVVLAGVDLVRRAGALPLASDLEETCALARAKRFDEAQARMSRYLEVFPDDPRGNLLMAQFSLDRPDPQPDLALRHLRRVRAGSAREAAIVEFCAGKAHLLQRRHDLAEARWREALRLDPTVPEAAWALLDLLELEDRLEEAQALGMWIHETEPEPRDRVRALLELARLDVDRVAPESAVPIFHPLHLQHPEDLTLALVAGRMLIRNSQLDEGIEILRDAVRRHPESARAWDAWLTGLVDSSRPEEFAREFGRLPRPLREHPRFARHHGHAAEVRKDWPSAVRAYRLASAHEPSNKAVLNRLRTSLRIAGDLAEAGRADRRFRDVQDALGQMRDAYTQARAIPTLGVLPHPEVYRRMADLRERVGRSDEALAWHRLVLRDAPGDPVSLAALERLKYDQKSAARQPPTRLSDIFQD